MAWRPVRDARGLRPVAWTDAADDPRRPLCVDQGIESTVLALGGLDGPVVSRDQMSFLKARDRASGMRSTECNDTDCKNMKLML